METSRDLPIAFGPELVIRFFPDYAATHPLWFHFDVPDLSVLALPGDLSERLHRWSDYWDRTFHWDRGWPPGAPDRWWIEERDRLPHDVAIAFGSDFIVEFGDLYLHSTASAGSAATAAAAHALIAAEAAERARIHAEFASGTRYDAVAGGSSYADRLGARPQDEDLDS
jgi:hypothetical protein